MKLINQKIEHIIQESNSNKKELLINMFKHIEKCSRTCYKSEDKITDKSYIKLIHNLIANKHFAMLEFGTMYFKIPVKSLAFDEALLWNNPWVKIDSMRNNYYITTNYRFYLENGMLKNYIKYLCLPEEFHERRDTYKFTTNRAIANELVRHKLLCVA